MGAETSTAKGGVMSTSVAGGEFSVTMWHVDQSEVFDAFRGVPGEDEYREEILRSRMPDIDDDPYSTISCGIKVYSVEELMLVIPRCQKACSGAGRLQLNCNIRNPSITAWACLLQESERESMKVADTATIVQQSRNKNLLSRVLDDIRVKLNQIESATMESELKEFH